MKEANMQNVISKQLASLLALCLAGTSGLAQQPAPKTDYQQIGKRYVSAKFGADRKSLIKTLAPEVLLLGGHEYLKKEYGLNPTGDRRKPIKVKRDILVDLDLKVYSTFSADEKQEIKQLLARSVYRFLIAERDGMKLNPWNPQDTEKTTLSLPTKKGDVVMIVLPEPKGDYLLYVMRKVDEAWKIVMDYTD